MPLSPLRLGLAFVLAPWAAPVVDVAHSILVSPGARPLHYDLPWVFLVAALVAYCGLVLFGIPLLLLLRRLRLLSLISLVPSGAALGVVAFYVFARGFEMLMGSPPGPFTLRDGFAGAVFGASVAAAFGVIAGITIGSSDRGVSFSARQGGSR